MRAHLDRIATINPLINALVQVLPTEIALEQARAADAVFRRNPASCGKLHGVPVSIKDGRKVKGFTCSLGNRSPLNSVATEDATIVARLRSAGAIVVGISNIPDFSMSYDTDNLLYGRTNNPYDVRRSPGGSTLTLAQTEVFSETEGKEQLIALLTATLMAVEGREGIAD